MTDIIERAEMIIEGVTEGPWGTYATPPYEIFREPTADYYGDYICDKVLTNNADAHFIAWARSGVPELLVELKAARAENKRLTDALIRIQTTR